MILQTTILLAILSKALSSTSVSGTVLLSQRSSGTHNIPLNVNRDGTDLFGTEQPTSLTINTFFYWGDLNGGAFITEELTVTFPDNSSTGTFPSSTLSSTSESAGEFLTGFTAKTVAPSDLVLDTGTGVYQLPLAVVESSSVFNYNILLTVSGTYTSSASGGGDPHFNAYGHQFFTFQGLCDVVLSKSRNAANGLGFRMHGRLSAPGSNKKLPTENKYTYISEVALMIGQDVYEIKSEEGKIFLNGKLLNFEDKISNHAVQVGDSNSLSAHAGSLITLTKTIRGKRKNIVVYAFNFGSGSLIKVRSNLHFKMVFVDMEGDFFGADVGGLLGTPGNNGILFGRDGQEMSKENINTYGAEWQVTESEPKLFMDANRFPQAPDRCLVVDFVEAKTQLRGRRKLLELDDGSKVDLAVAARNACAHLHGVMKEFCVNDVILTGELELAEDPFYMG